MITTDILALTSTAFNAVVLGLVGTTLGGRSVSSVPQSKIASQDKVTKKHEAATGCQQGTGPDA